MTESMGPMFYPGEKLEVVGGPYDGKLLLIPYTWDEPIHYANPTELAQHTGFILTGRKTKAGHWEARPYPNSARR